VIDVLSRAFLVLQGAHGTLLERTHSDQGASTVQYALLVAIMALVVAVLVALLGTGARGLFGSAHTCANGLTTTACRVGPHLRGSANVQGP
jgi:Flp pilus assembly pilin Flp